MRLKTLEIFGLDVEMAEVVKLLPIHLTEWMTFLTLILQVRISRMRPNLVYATLPNSPSLHLSLR